MAVIRSLTWVDEGGRVHPTEVDCELRAVTGGGQSYLQLSTFGSDHRQREKKVSQTLQLDRSSALALAVHISRLFGDPATASK